MLNKAKLKGKIYSKGLKIRDMSEPMGLKGNGYCRKITVGSDFTTTQISKLIKILDLTAEEVIDIFFAEEVEKNKTKDQMP